MSLGFDLVKLTIKNPVLCLCLVFLTGCGGGSSGSLSSASSSSSSAGSESSSTSVASSSSASNSSSGNSSETTYKVGGSVQGLASSGVILSLNNTTLSIQNGATTFEFQTYLASGQAYSVAVTMQPVGQICSVNNGSGTIANANVTNVLVFCQNLFKLQTWVDNWFSVNVVDTYGRTFNAEDSVAYQTIKSFNADTFNFKANYPFDLNFVIKDYIQMNYLNGDTGLEYINNVGGTQQVGDGGFIMQVIDTASNKVVAVSDNNFKCLVTHHAPANPLNQKCLLANPTTASDSCGLPTKVAEPTNWTQMGFNTSAWISPSYYSVQDVGVKPDYYTINWDASAKLIWGPDLKLDNWLICKLTVNAPL